MLRIFSHQKFLAVYSGVLTIVLTVVVLLGARKSEPNASFDQITVHRINVIEPDGTTRLVISNNAEFPGAYYNGTEYPRTDRDATGMLFNNEEGTENGGLIFGGKKDKDGSAHSWGHLSFDEYEQDQTTVIESDSDGDSRNTYYGVNDISAKWSLTPEVMADWQRWKAMPSGPEREAARKALATKYPGGIVNRGYFGRGRDKSVSLSAQRPGRARTTGGTGSGGRRASHPISRCPWKSSPHHRRGLRREYKVAGCLSLRPSRFLRELRG